LAVNRARAADDGETREQGALNRHAISPIERAIALLGFDEIASIAVAIIHDGRGQLATACVLG
jgi:hypothetical protein